MSHAASYQPLPWTANHGPFCEGAAWQWPSEWFSSGTAILISALGIYGLYANWLEGPQARTFFAWLVINGGCSCVFHLTLQRGWDLMDKWSMVIFAYSGAFYAIDGIAHYNRLVKDKTPETDNWRGYITDSSFFSVLFNSAMLVTIVLGAVSSKDAIAFSVMFGIPVIIVVLAGLVVYRNYRIELMAELNENILSKEDAAAGYFCACPKCPCCEKPDNRGPIRKKKDRMKNLYARGCIFGLFGAALWQSTENLCENTPEFRILFGHAIWHFTFAYGMYCILVSMLALKYFLVYKESFKFRSESTLDDNHDLFSWMHTTRFWFEVFPAVTAEIEGKKKHNFVMAMVLQQALDDAEVSD